MFSCIEPESVSLLLTLISYIGFFATGCFGFNILNTTGFDINIFLISLSSFLFSMVFMILELAYYLKYEFMDSFRNIYYLRFVLLLGFGTIILGIDTIGLTFGLIAITSSIVNIFVGIFDDYDRSEEEEN